MTAIQMTTLNTAEHFGVSRDVGMIAPGRFADVLLVDDLSQMQPAQVIARGGVIAENGRLVIDMPAYAYPDWAIQSVHLARPLTKHDFNLTIPEHGRLGAEAVIAHVIGVIENQAPTRHLKMEVQAQDGEVKADIQRDLAKIALVERHKAAGRVQVGLVHGFGFNAPCAIGSTVAHDSHHMIVVGTDEANMAAAANELARIGGGQVVVYDGNVIGSVDLPIAGLMSSERADIVARKAASVLEGFRRCGCTLNNPNMQLSLLALVVIPELRISDLGLVDVTRFEFIPLFEKAA
jgi:adenine deaminase